MSTRRRNWRGRCQAGTEFGLTCGRPASGDHGLQLCRKHFAEFKKTTAYAAVFDRLTELEGRGDQRLEWQIQREAEQREELREIERAWREDIEQLKDKYESQSALPNGKQVYYLLVRPDVVKIGTTVNLHSRLCEHRKQWPKARLLGVEPGGRRKEAARHAEFSAERQPTDGSRETFRLSPRLRHHIDALVSAAS